MRADAHVVGHEVDQLPHARRLDRRAELLVARFAAELAAQAVVIDDVVAVRRSGRGLERRRDVDVGDTELGEIGDQGRGVLETERRGQL